MEEFAEKCTQDPLVEGLSRKLIVNTICNGILSKLYPEDYFYNQYLEGLKAKSKINEKAKEIGVNLP